MADHFLKLIGEQEYWEEHPDLFGAHPIPNDPFGRKSVWALRKGKSKKTIVMNGHMDCVEIDCYGSLKQVALHPDQLRPELKKIFTQGEVARDLEDENWIFGRGVADMKGGIACILYTLFQTVNPDVNLLFLTTPDEEHQSEGIMSCAALLKDLKEKHDLEYVLAIIPEPQNKRKEGTYLLSYGSIGKILPVIVARGRQSHTANLMQGLNPTLMLANVIRKLDLNPDLIARELGDTTPPPCVLQMRDNKETYNISTPLYTEAYVHIYIAKNTSVSETMQLLVEYCKEAGKETMEAYDRAYDAMYGVKPKDQQMKMQAFTYEKLDDYCKQVNPEYTTLKKEYLQNIAKQIQSNQISIQEGGIQIIEKTIEWSYITDPIYVVGLLPPFCPAVNSLYFDEHPIEHVKSIMHDVLHKHKLELDTEAYYMGISDFNYISLTQIEQEIESMKQVVVPSQVYSINFDDIVKIAMPCIFMGPWGKDYHTEKERVYAPELETLTVELVQAIINEI